MTTATEIKMYLDNGMMITLTKGERMIATMSIHGVRFSGEVCEPTGIDTPEKWIAYSLLKGIYSLSVREYKDAINTLMAEVKGLAA